MAELSIFCDESGEQAQRSPYYLLTLVFHEQDDDLGPAIAGYERSLAVKGLPDIPLHTAPLLNGIGPYAGLDFKTRLSLLSSFRVLLHNLPIKYKTFVFENKTLRGPRLLESAMRKSLVLFFFEYLNYLQQFSQVKFYYDDGQQIVKRSVRDALEYALSRRVLTYRRDAYAEYRLAQAADFICTVELVALRYGIGAPSATDCKAFGSGRDFRRNVLRDVRRKALG